jgi:hypothetical protein
MQPMGVTPQIRFALSRGFAKCGRLSGPIYPGRRSQNSLAPGYIYVAPMGLSVCGFVDS